MLTLRDSFEEDEDNENSCEVGGGGRLGDGKNTLMHKNIYTYP
jgi:hypothetical protein